MCACVSACVNTNLHCLIGGYKYRWQELTPHSSDLSRVELKSSFFSSNNEFLERLSGFSASFTSFSLFVGNMLEFRYKM